MIDVYKFTMATCGPCKALSSMLRGVPMKEIKAETDSATFQKFGVRKVPTLIFFKDGHEVHRTTGIISKEDFDALLLEINDAKETKDEGTKQS